MTQIKRPLFNLNIYCSFILALVTFSAFGQNFKHPGLLSSKAELDFVKAKIKANAEPWTKAYKALLNENVLGLVVKAIPNSTTAATADEFTFEGSTAYASALIWYMNGDKRYADKAIEILNKWSIFESSLNELYLSWAVPHFINAAEILRYTPNSGWNPTDITKFNTMVRAKMLPVNRLSPNVANILLASIESHMAMAIYLDERVEFDKAIVRWKTAQPTVFYLVSDGVPKKNVREFSPYDVVDSWKNRGPYIDGLNCETCRDLNHTKMSMFSSVYAAEMAWKQGVDLFSIEKVRLSKTFELHAGWMTGATAVPATLCQGTGKINCDGYSTNVAPCNVTVFEIAANHLVTRLGMNMPKLSKMNEDNRPNGGVNMRQQKFETLTHALIPTLITELEKENMPDKVIASIYPNPSREGIFILPNPCPWKVFSSLGQEIKTGTGNKIDLSGNLRGIYFIQIADSMERVVIE